MTREEMSVARERQLKEFESRFRVWQEAYRDDPKSARTEQAKTDVYTNIKQSSPDRKRK